MSRKVFLTTLALIFAGIVGVNAQVTVDRALPVYAPVPGISGSIKSVGSDSMNNMIALWAEDFSRMYPAVRVEIEGRGSSTAPPALIAGTAQFGAMSRLMRSAEVDRFQAAFGYPPTMLRTSIDMLAVFVHKDNPIAQRGLTLQEVDAIFSVNRRGGHARDIRTWGDLGLTGEWAAQPIDLHGRNAASGTAGYFKEVALFGGDFKPTVKELPGTSAVVQGVATNRFAIGYGGIGYLTADVRAVPLATATGRPFIPPTGEFAYTGDYPLSRFFVMYVNHRPGTALDPLRREFIRFIFSQQGQAAVLRDGYFPITNAIARTELAKVGIR